MGSKSCLDLQSMQEGLCIYLRFVYACVQDQDINSEYAKQCAESSSLANFTPMALLGLLKQGPLSKQWSLAIITGAITPGYCCSLGQICLVVTQPIFGNYGDRLVQLSPCSSKLIHSPSSTYTIALLN